MTMVVRRGCVLVVVVVMVTVCVCEMQHSQHPNTLTPAAAAAAAGPVGNTARPLKEYFDHAELKASPAANNDTEDLTTTTTTTIKTPPSPIPIKRKNSQYEDEQEETETKKKYSVPKKGVPPLKPSVVPKKEVHFAPSVVGKKGADPENSTPSVSPRKGVRLPGESTRVDDLLLLSSENMQNTNANTNANKNANYLTHGTKPSMTAGINLINNRDGTEKITPVPKLVSAEQTTPTTPRTTTTTGTAKSNLRASVHYKPATADDIGEVKQQISYAPIFMIVALVLLVVVVVVVGYHRLKDVWSRRHYNYVDFLIDGMYE